jgi:AhpD family alkylhydroperoxidase
MKKVKVIQNADTIRATVREGYSEIAKGGGSCCGADRKCSDDLVQQIGYATDELSAVPEGANMGLSCGNPTAIASLKPGEVVLDLGSGGGFDVFIAGSKVGPTGRAIGVDITPDMLTKARRNIEPYRTRTGLDNVEFRLGEIEHLPVADASVDVVISNCVINLSPDKPQVWREIARVLKPGGRVAVSDLALRKPLPSAIREMVEALVGCIAGAVLVEETRRMVREAGLTDIELISKGDYLQAKADWNDPLYRKIMQHLPANAEPKDYITSLEVKARRPATTNADAMPYTPAMAELVAIGAAIASNCEPCFKHHYGVARKLGVPVEAMTQAVNTAQAVKQAPARAILELADRFLHGNFMSPPETACCPGTHETTKAQDSCSPMTSLTQDQTEHQ